MFPLTLLPVLVNEDIRPVKLQAIGQVLDCILFGGHLEGEKQADFVRDGIFLVTINVDSVGIARLKYPLSGSTCLQRLDEGGTFEDAESLIMHRALKRSPTYRVPRRWCSHFALAEFDPIVEHGRGGR